jgi:hypothetical protein
MGVESGKIVGPFNAKLVPDNEPELHNISDEFTPEIV